MRKIPVTRDGKKGSETVLIDIEKVVKIECIRDKEYMIHTLEEVFYYTPSLDGFEEWLYEDGFRLIDQTNLVNMNYVTRYDVAKGLVHLGSPDTRSTKQASAARIHKEHILNVMKMIQIAASEEDQGYPRGSETNEKMNELIESSRNDQFLRSYATIQAIYERRLAEKRLEESEQRYKSLYKNNPDAIVSLDQFGNFISVNPATERITGYSMEELLGNSILQMIAPEDMDRWNLYFHKALQGETQFYEFSFVHKNGYNVILETIHVPIIVNNEIAGVYAISKDVTEKKQAEELLIKSEKLSIVGQLAAGVAHEIRNPLTSLKGFVQLLKGRIRDYDHFFDIMESELDRINFIVSEFLVIAKQQVVNYQYKDPRDILLSTLALLNSQALMNNVEIVNELDEELPPIHCDENQIKQVFINILNNSIDAMPEGGRIIVKSHILNHGGELLLTFIDHGVGIPEERLPRLGEPFYTTKEKGTGLGLMVSYKIIESHQGQMTIKSKVGHGTTVNIVLPLSRDQANYQRS